MAGGYLGYREFISAEDWRGYQRGKEVEHRLATIHREVLAQFLGGWIGGHNGSRKQYVNARLGMYRVAISHNSDNSTESEKNEELGALTIDVSKRKYRLALWSQYGLLPIEETDRRYEAEVRHRWDDGRPPDQLEFGS